MNPVRSNKSEIYADSLTSRTSNGMNPQYIIFPSSKSLLLIGIISAIIAPIIGIVLGFYFLRRPQLIKESRAILLVASFWLITIFIIAF